MTMLDTLLEMGFSKLKAEKAVTACGENLDQAMEWLLAHQDDPSLNTVQDAVVPMAVDDVEVKTEAEVKTDAGAKTDSKPDGESSTSEEAEAKSLKCDECGKLFKTSEEVEFHAVKSGHASFSESTEEKKTMTEDEKQEKLKELEGRMKSRRIEKVETDRSDALDKEKKRIQSGKDMAEAKRKFEETEMKLITQQRRREKLEDKLARQRVKDEIERDRLARRQQQPSQSEFSNRNLEPVKVPSAAPPVLPEIKKDYKETRLQIRVPSGPPLVQAFKANESLAAVRLWVQMNRSGGSEGPDFTLSTTFPRRVFTKEDEEKPLSALDLVPSAVLVMAEMKS